MNPIHKLLDPEKANSDPSYQLGYEAGVVDGDNRGWIKGMEMAAEICDLYEFALSIYPFDDTTYGGRMYDGGRRDAACALRDAIRAKIAAIGR